MENGQVALASCIVHEKEKLDYDGKYEALFQNYVNKQVGDIFKLTLLEYLKLPSYISTIVDRVCLNELSKKSKALDDIEVSMQKKT